MGGNDRLLHRCARRIDENALLTQDFLRLADLTVFSAALIDRHFEAGGNTRRGVVKTRCPGIAGVARHRSL